MVFFSTFPPGKMVCVRKGKKGGGKKKEEKERKTKIDMWTIHRNEPKKKLRALKLATCLC